ncbi:hypothetical protein [Hoeflea poritis]|uniref:Uncharacterized protein n=1 Tax=Hoeflea poritis TaxID=2993659 RepID=A0ABT4VKJ5_9HYPH|nr:hypothetical protein [Hoeflea poritis]MDA4845238.1 hypothetical protein [Hoeflea poritis]
MGEISGKTSNYVVIEGLNLNLLKHKGKHEEEFYSSSSCPGHHFPGHHVIRSKIVIQAVTSATSLERLSQLEPTNLQLEQHGHSMPLLLEQLALRILVPNLTVCHPLARQPVEQRFQPVVQRTPQVVYSPKPGFHVPS